MLVEFVSKCGKNRCKCSCNFHLDRWCFQFGRNLCDKRVAYGVCEMCKAHQSTVNWQRAHSTAFDWLGLRVCAWLYFDKLAYSEPRAVLLSVVLCCAWLCCAVLFFRLTVCHNVYFKHGWLCYRGFVFNARSMCIYNTVLVLFHSHISSGWYRCFGLQFPNRFRCCPFKCHLLLLSIFMNGFAVVAVAVVFLCFYFAGFFSPYHIHCCRKWFAFQLFAWTGKWECKAKRISWNSFVKNSFEHKNDWW